MSSAAAMFSRFREAQHNDEFMAFSTDPAAREILIALAEENGWPASAVQDGGFSGAVQFLVSAPAPQRLVVDLSDKSDAASAVQMLRDACDPDTVIVALGTVNDIELFRELTKAGAADYLVKPLKLDDVREALEKAVQRAGAGPDDPRPKVKDSRLIVFVGARGGIGASTVAMNTAWLMAHEQKVRTVLVDLDLQFGTIALNLDLDPTHGLREALEHPGRIDGLFIVSALVSESENLMVLASEEPLEDVVTPSPEASGLLFDELRQTFPCIVTDLPREGLAHHRAMLAKADHVAVVCDLSLPCVRDTLRLLSLVGELAPEAKVSLLANRVQPGGRGQIGRRDFERGVERKIDCVVPEDAKAATAAANAGKPLPVVSRRSPVARTLRQFGAGLVGDMGRTEKSGKGRRFPWPGRKS